MKKIFLLFDSFKKRVKDYFNYTPVFIGINCQHEKLKDKMYQAEMKHGTTAIVNLDNIKLKHHGGFQYNNLDLFFCDMKPIEVVEIIEKGDGKEIPNHMSQINDFKAEKAGVYRIENVSLTSNGTIQLNKTPETKIVFVRELTEKE